MTSQEILIIGVCLVFNIILLFTVIAERSYYDKKLELIRVRFAGQQHSITSQRDAIDYLKGAVKSHETRINKMKSA